MSRTSLAEGADRLEALLDVTPDAAARIRLGEELFAVTALLDSSASLRRALTDPARQGRDKAGLAERLIGSRVARDTLDLLSGLVRSRWSQPRDLADATDRLGISAVLAGGEAGDRLDTVETEVHQVGRQLSQTAELRQALLEPRASAEARASLAERLMGDEVAPETSVLVRHVVADLRGLRPEDAFAHVAAEAARRRERLVAHVTVAAWPSDEQRARLTRLLSVRYGRAVRLAIDLDPETVGGVRVQVGDEVVDGTTSRRLATAAEGLRS